jgi:hypothetical protein
VGAFSPAPDGNRSGLRIEGDARLAHAFLDGLALSAPHQHSSAASAA